ncbi:MAG TPA: DNA polymerase Y family protein [Thermoanaerobaculia bacterium]|nr:DNA polymerase Y family protein [Thermoanaerobaculia bacterium]
MIRIGCFFVPMFPLAARLRSEPDLLHEALAIVAGNGNNAHVIAATRRARKKGIHAGLSLAQARSILPKLIARGRDEACERAAQEALLEVAETFSPRVEDAGDGLAYVDISGTERLFGGQRAAGGGRESEQELAKAAIRAIEDIGLPARVGIAASKLAARVAAELPQTPTVVTPGDEAKFLAPLPLARLSPELEAAAMLQRFGLTTIGDLARLPENEIASRLGDIGRELHFAARGIDPRPLIPRPLPPEFREGMELEWPLVALEPFVFIANAALDRLSKRMEMQGFACKRIEITLTLEPDGYDARAIDLPAPTRDVKTILTLIRLDLEKRPPGAPVIGFTFVAQPDRPRRAQLSLFGPAALSPEKLATTIARLISMLGDGRVGMPMTVDGHLPERHDIAEFAPPPPPDTRRPPPRARGLLAARTFRPPIPVEVITERGTIASVRGENIEGSVRVCSGPWRIEEGWWRDAPAEREYWDVELWGGGIYRVYQAAATKEWFVDARFGM